MPSPTYAERKMRKEALAVWENRKMDSRIATGHTSISQFQAPDGNPEIDYRPLEKLLGSDIRSAKTWHSIISKAVCLLDSGESDGTGKYKYEVGLKKFYTLIKSFGQSRRIQMGSLRENLIALHQSKESAINLWRKVEKARGIDSVVMSKPDDFQEKYYPEFLKNISRFSNNFSNSLSFARYAQMGIEEFRYNKGEKYITDLEKTVMSIFFSYLKDHNTNYTREKISLPETFRFSKKRKVGSRDTDNTFLETLWNIAGKKVETTDEGKLSPKNNNQKNALRRVNLAFIKTIMHVLTRKKQWWDASMGATEEIENMIGLTMGKITELDRGDHPEEREKLIKIFGAMMAGIPLLGMIVCYNNDWDFPLWKALRQTQFIKECIKQMAKNMADIGRYIKLIDHFGSILGKEKEIFVYSFDHSNVDSKVFIKAIDIPFFPCSRVEKRTRPVAGGNGGTKTSDLLREINILSTAMNMGIDVPGRVKESRKQAPVHLPSQEYYGMEEDIKEYKRKQKKTLKGVDIEFSFADDLEDDPTSKWCDEVLSSPESFSPNIPSSSVGLGKEKKRKEKIKNKKIKKLFSSPESTEELGIQETQESDEDEFILDFDKDNDDIDWDNPSPERYNKVFVQPLDPDTHLTNKQAARSSEKDIDRGEPWTHEEIKQAICYKPSPRKQWTPKPEPKKEETYSWATKDTFTPPTNYDLPVVKPVMPPSGKSWKL